MATETLTVTGVGTGADDWALGAGASKAAAVATPDDDDTSYIAEADGSGTQSFALSDPSVVQPEDTIESVTVVSRVRRVGGTAVVHHADVRTSGGTTAGASTNPSTSYANKTDIFTEKPGGGAWDTDALRGLEIDQVCDDPSGTCRCTTITVTVTYTVAAGSSRRDGWKHAYLGI